MMIRPNGSAGEQTAYSAGYFSQFDDSFVVKQSGGVSPLGSLLCSIGSDYAVEVRPDGYSRSCFAGLDVSAPAMGGKSWYLKDGASGDTWSAFFNPVCDRADDYEVRYSPGCASVYSLSHKIGCTLTVACVPDSPCELWHVKIRNHSASDRTISFTTYLEPSVAQALESKYLAADRALLMRRRLEAIEVDATDGAAQDLVLVHSSTLTPSRWQNEKMSFIGEGRSLRNPMHVERDDSMGADGDTRVAICSFTIDVELPIEGEAEFAFCFGLAGSAERALDLARNYSTIEDVNDALRTSRDRWADICSTTRVHTCDRTFDALVNTWLPYEAYAAWVSERGRSGFEPSRVADVLKGVYALSGSLPILCRDRLMSFAAGLTMLGCYSGPNGSLVAIPTREMLWLVLAASSYAAETGDLDLLDETVSLCNGPELTLREHCGRAIGLCITDSKEPDPLRDLLLEKALCGWMMAAGDDGTLGAQLEKVRARRRLEEVDEDVLLPQRLRYFQNASHTLSDKRVVGLLREHACSAEWLLNDAGVSAMLYCSLVEGLLGLIPTAQGLIVDPRLPGSWSECSLVREYRDDTYRIHIRKSTSGASGRPAIVVDDEPLLGAVLPYFGDGREHVVEMIVA